MTKSLSYTFFIVIALLVISCEDKSYHGNEQDLMHTWILIDLPGIQLNNVREMNIEFLDSNLLTAQSSCNYFYGHYTVTNNNSMKISDLSSTYVYCTMEVIRQIEEQYFQSLNSVSNFSVEEDILIIYTSSGEELQYKIKN